MSQKSLFLGIKLETARSIPQCRIARLIEENENLEDVMAMLAEDDGSKFDYQGDMWLGAAHYILVGINITKNGGGSILKANVLIPQR